MFRCVLAVAILVPASSLAAPAAAQDVFGAYVQVHGGLFVPMGDEFSVPLVTTGGGDERATFDIDTDLGYTVGALLGYDVGAGLAVEVEATLRSNDVSTDDDSGIGDEETVAVMLNGVYTFTVPFLADPFVGLGAGYLKPRGDVDAFEGTFAYQAKAGLLWPVGVGEVLTEVVYLGTGGLEEDAFDTELDYSGFSANLGYRFSF